MRRLARRRDPADASLEWPRAGRSSPAVVYAGILDGRTLWLALDGLAESDDVVLCGEQASWRVPEEKAEWVPTEWGGARWSARIPLDELPGDTAAVFELRAGSDGAAPPVRCALAPTAPTRTPILADGNWRFGLSTTPEGALELRRDAAPAVRPVRQLGAGADCLWVRYPAADDNHRLLVLDDDQRVVARLPTALEGDTARSEIEVVALPPDLGRWRLAVGTDTDWSALVRPWHDLSQPTRSVTLPALHGRDGAATLRFSWNPGGWLNVALADPATGIAQ